MSGHNVQIHSATSTNIVAKILVSDISATYLVGLEEEDYFCKGDTDDLCRRLSEKIRTNRHRAYDLSCYNWRTIARQVGEVNKSVLPKQ